MINNELITFVLQQLKNNVPREKITQGLKANGWNDTDINEAFAYIGNNPNNTPAINSNFANFSSVQINESSNSLTNPNKKTAFGVLILCALIPALLINIIIALSPLGALISSVLPINGPIVISASLFIVYIIAILIGSLGMKFSAKVFKFDNTSFAKAMVNESVVLLILIAMSVLASFWGMIGVVIATVLNIVLFTMFTRWQYKTTILKAFVARILSRIMFMIVGFIFGIIGALAMGVLAGVNRAREKDMQARGLVPQIIFEEKNTQEDSLLGDQNTTKDPTTTPIQNQNIDSWQSYSYPTENFSVKFPVEPKITNRTEDTSRGPLLIKITEASFPENGDVLKYNVEYIDLPEATFNKTDTKEVREAKGLAFYGMMLKLVYGSNATLSIDESKQGQGRYLYEIKIPNKKLFQGRIVVQDDKVYSYGAECEKCTTIPNFEAYLASFHY